MLLCGLDYSLLTSAERSGIWCPGQRVKGLQHVKQSLVQRRRHVDQKQVDTTKKFT